MFYQQNTRSNSCLVRQSKGYKSKISPDAMFFCQKKIVKPTLFINFATSIKNNALYKNRYG